MNQQQEQIRKIIHVDMDCFYAAVEMRDNPSLAHKAIAIGGPSNSRGVLCTANYAARKFGVRAAMPSFMAIQKCPELIIVKPNFSKYKEASQKVHQIFKRYTDKIQPLSLDEAYLDVTDCLLFENSATLIAKDIKKAIFNETSLTASAGVAPNKFLAKVASDWKKPDGLFTIAPNEVNDFIIDLDVKLIPGVGKVTLEKLHQLQIKTCSDLQKKDLPFLVKHFGKFGHALKNRSFGIDHSPVEVSTERKSLSLEHTLDSNITLNHLRDYILSMIPELKERFIRVKKREPQTKIRKVFVKIKTFDFKRHTAEMIIDQELIQKLEDGHFELEYVIDYLIENVKEKILDKELRLVGLGFRFDEEKSTPQLRLI